MNRKILFTLAIATLLVASPVLAEENQGKQSGPMPAVRNIDEFLKNMDARGASTTKRIEMLKTEINKRKASTTIKRIDIQQDVAKRKADQTAAVMNATITKLEAIIVRIEAR